MAVREYSLNLRNTANDTKTEVLKEVGIGWLRSSFEERLLEVLREASNARGDVVVKITVTDAT